MKKILKIGLCFILLINIFIMETFSNNIYGSQSVTHYVSSNNFVSKVNEASSGDVIVLTEDVTFDTPIILDKSITIDLSGNTLTSDVVAEKSFMLNEGCIYFTIIGTKEDSKVVATDPTSYMTDSGFIGSTTNAKVTLQGGDYTITNYSSNVVCIVDVHTTITSGMIIELNNLSIDSNQKVIRLTTSSSIDLKVNNCVINSASTDSGFIFELSGENINASFSNTTIHADSNWGGSSCVCVNNKSSATFKNCDLSIDVPYDTWGSAILVRNNGKVKIDGGSYYGEYGVNILDYGGSVDIESGTFYGTIGALRAEAGEAFMPHPFQELESSIINIYGGIINGDLEVVDRIQDDESIAEINAYGGYFTNLTNALVPDLYRKIDTKLEGISYTNVVATSDSGLAVEKPTTSQPVVTTDSNGQINASVQKVESIVLSLLNTRALTIDDNSNEVDLLEQIANKVVESLTTDDEQKAVDEFYKDNIITTKDKVKFLVDTRFDIELHEYNDELNDYSLVIDVKPIAKITAITTSISGEVSKVIEERKIDIDKEIELWISIDKDVYDVLSTWSNVYIRHEKDDGTSFYYSTQESNLRLEKSDDETEYYIVFTNPNGFSTFQPLNKKLSTKVTFKNYDNTIIGNVQTLDEGNVVTVPSNPIKPSSDTHDYIFVGWKPSYSSTLYTSGTLYATLNDPEYIAQYNAVIKTPSQNDNKQDDSNKDNNQSLVDTNKGNNSSLQNATNKTNDSNKTNSPNTSDIHNVTFFIQLFVITLLFTIYIKKNQTSN